MLNRLKVNCITQEDRLDIEFKTRGQNKSKSWQKQRILRMQSSNFGRICTATDRTNYVKLAESFLSSTNINSAPLQHGIQYEPMAIKRYEDTTSTSTSSCGIFVSLSHP